VTLPPSFGAVKRIAGSRGGTTRRPPASRSMESAR
jgi:hypothetical protein